VNEPALVYEELGPIAPEAAELALNSGDRNRISRALLRSALHGPHWDRAETWAVDRLRHPDPWVRSTAATSLGHIARVHGHLTLDRAIPELLRLLADPDAAGHAEDALDDIEIFWGVRRDDYRPTGG
jgi:hypothetical protein